VQVAPGDQLRDGDDRQVLALAQSEDVGRPQYFTGVVDDFADRTDRWQPRQPAQVDGCLGVSDALEDSPRLGAQRQHMAGADQVGRVGVRVAQDAQRGGSIRRGDPGRDSGRGVHAHGVRGPQRVGIVRHHQGQPETVGPLVRHRGAEITRGVPHHPPDPFR